MQHNRSFRYTLAIWVSDLHGIRHAHADVQSSLTLHARELTPSHIWQAYITLTRRLPLQSM